jgi:membrane protein DedA with SNARE-associated domain
MGDHARGKRLSGLEQAIFDLIKQWYIHTGYIGIVLAMAVESCCIPLPSEIVMPLAGYFVYCSSKQIASATSCPPHANFTLIGVAVAGAIGCVIGSAIAYAIGAAGGRPLLLRYGKYVLISHADSDRADRWFARWGAPAVFFGRLLPVVRTYISLPAGISEMNFGTFIIFTLLGSLPWTFTLAWIGLGLGNQIDKATQLSSVFHGLDVLVLVLLAAAVAYYIYRHIQRSRAAEEQARNSLGPSDMQRLRR